MYLRFYDKMWSRKKEQVELEIVQFRFLCRSPGSLKYAFKKVQILSWRTWRVSNNILVMLDYNIYCYRDKIYLIRHFKWCICMCINEVYEILLWRHIMSWSDVAFTLVLTPYVIRALIKFIIFVSVLNICVRLTINIFYIYYHIYLNSLILISYSILLGVHRNMLFK